MAIVLYTDFTAADIYVGQMKAVLLEHAPGVAIVDLFHDVPDYDIRAGAHLLAACLPQFPVSTVFLAVVDPGVGTERDAVVLECDGRYLVGPDNGLMSVCAARAAQTRCWSIAWRPPKLSASFHGRDLFAPVAAAIAADCWPTDRVVAKPALHVQLGGADLAQIVYIDHYGNACTGLRASGVPNDAIVATGDSRLHCRRVFGAAAPGEPFWYENSLGLVEIAACRASAAKMLGLTHGLAVQVL